MLHGIRGVASGEQGGGGRVAGADLKGGRQRAKKGRQILCTGEEDLKMTDLRDRKAKK